jgi:hypothetical protein
MKDQSEHLRMRLATVGIFLDDPKPSRAPSASPTSEPEPLDRDKIRALLTSGGAPDRDLDWLTASCPSYVLAAGYRPPPQPISNTEPPIQKGNPNE